MNGITPEQNEATTPLPQQEGAVPPEAVNGSSGASKKRKKDALKPIITTETPTGSTAGYVKPIFHTFVLRVGWNCAYGT
jgi:hypothetical protein